MPLRIHIYNIIIESYELARICMLCEMVWYGDNVYNIVHLLPNLSVLHVLVICKGMPLVGKTCLVRIFCSQLGVPASTG